VLTFAVSILSFFFASKFVVGENNVGLQYAIGCIGGVMGSWSIGAFFMMPYLVPAQVSSVEEKLTGKNHSAMYFAAQALISSIVSAISGSLIYEWIKMLFISKDAQQQVRKLLTPKQGILSTIMGLPLILEFLMQKVDTLPMMSLTNFFIKIVEVLIALIGVVTSRRFTIHLTTNTTSLAILQVR
jgi:hypothetical protein